MIHKNAQGQPAGANDPSHGPNAKRVRLPPPHPSNNSGSSIPGGPPSDFHGQLVSQQQQQGQHMSHAQQPQHVQQQNQGHGHHGQHQPPGGGMQGGMHPSYGNHPGHAQHPQNSFPQQRF